jgi:hypothetical protein
LSDEDFWRSREAVPMLHSPLPHEQH